MKQIAQSQRDGKLKVLDVPVPALRPEGVLVATAYSVISAGTERAKVDLAKKSLLGKAMARPDQVRQVIKSARQAGLAATYQKVMTRLDAMNPLGYSSAGIVLAVGDHVRDIAPGDRVACAGAGFANHAEIAYVPRNLCARVPEGVALDEAAYATIGAIALQGIRQSGAALGEVVGVIGLGLIGLLTVQMLRAAGCRVVGFDLDPGRCDLALRFGADLALQPNADQPLRTIAPHGLDAVILTAATSSSDPIRLAGELARDRARVIVVGAVGMDIPRSPFYEKELEIRLSRSYGPGRYDNQYEERGVDYPVGYVRWTEGRNLEAFVDLLAQRKVDVAALTTHRFRLGAAEAAYDVIEGKSGERFLGVLIEYDPVDRVPQPAPIRLTESRAIDGKVKVAFVGAGNFAQSSLIPPLRANGDVHLRTVVTSSGLSARSVGERFGFEQCASNLSDVLGDREVDLIVVASRHDSHAATTAAALRAGKAVFTEKPLAINEGELADVERAFAESGRFLMVGFNRRFAPLVARMHPFVGSMSEPKVISYRVNAGFIPRDHWAHESGGRIIGEVCHFVDLMLHLAGAPIVSVHAAGLPDSNRYSRDNIVATLRFADGSVGTITYVANGPAGLEKERLEIVGGGKAAILDDFKKLTLIDGAKETVHRSAADKGHQNEMLAVVNALRSGAAAPIPFADIAGTTRATFDIVESITG